MEPYQSVSQLFISTNGFECIHASCGVHLRKAKNLDAFRELAELNLKVSLRIGPESVIGVSNSCDLAWIRLNSKHCR